MFFIRLNRFVICAFLAGLSFFALTSTMIPEWVDMRYYVPRRAIASLTMFVLFAAASLGYPSRSLSNTPKTVAPGSHADWNRLQAWDALHFPTPQRPSPWLMAQRHFLEMFGCEPGIILADTNPLFLNALLPDSFVAALLDGERYVRFRNVVTYDRAQALALVKRGLDESRVVYALFVSQKEMEVKAARLPQVDGYSWVVAEILPVEAVVLKLSPR
jgi:hypothetical protein